MNAEEGAALANLIPRPWIGFNRRFDPRLQRLRARVPAAGSLTLLIDLHYASGSWRPHAVDDDALLAVGTHLIDLARWLIESDIRRVRTRRLTPTQAAIELELDRGTTELSCATDQTPRDSIEVRDSTGRVLARHTGTGLTAKAVALWTMVRDRNLRRLIHPDSRTLLVRLLIQELEAFAAACAGPHRPASADVATSLASASDGLAVMAVVDAARRSARDHGSWQAVAPHAVDARAAVVVEHR